MFAESSCFWGDIPFCSVLLPEYELQSKWYVGSFPHFPLAAPIG